jgi:transposase-like protein
MYSKSTLSHPDAVSAVELFEQGFTAKSVALSLDLARVPVQMLYQRWQLRGSGALVTRDRKQYDFETKLEIVLRHIRGESGRALSEEFGLPSPSTVANWTSVFRRDGEDGLRPKRRGRPPTNRGDSPPESETEALRRENERLRAEVAYLGKLRALRSPGRR